MFFFFFTFLCCQVKRQHEPSKRKKKLTADLLYFLKVSLKRVCTLFSQNMISFSATTFCPLLTRWPHNNVFESKHIIMSEMNKVSLKKNEYSDHNQYPIYLQLLSFPHHFVQQDISSLYPKKLKLGTACVLFTWLTHS